MQFRGEVLIPLLQRGQPSSHLRTREIEREPQAKKKVDLYLQMVQLWGQGRVIPAD